MTIENLNTEEVQPGPRQIFGFVIILPVNPEVEGDKEMFLSKGFNGDYWTPDLQFARLFPTHEAMVNYVSQINSRNTEKLQGRWVTIDL